MQKKYSCRLKLGSIIMPIFQHPQPSRRYSHTHVGVNSILIYSHVRQTERREYAC